MGVDAMLFDPVVPKVFYFKHSVGSFNAMVFIGNPNVDSLRVIGDAILVLA